MDLIMGLGKTGKSLIQHYEKLKKSFLLYDGNEDLLRSYEDRGYEVLHTLEDIQKHRICQVIKSPGIPPSDPVVSKCKALGIPVLSDIGYFYQVVQPKNSIAITGTNGKTTVTRMLGELFKKQKPIVAGNVGTPIMDCQEGQDSMYILEVSSFQLEDGGPMKPKVSILLNVEEDHLSWHGNFANYKKAKYTIFEQQDSSDYLILNYDDPNLGDVHTNSQVLYFSLSEKTNAYVEGDRIEIRNGKIQYSIPISSLPYKEKHNLQNYMAAFLVASIYTLTEDEVMEMVGNFRLDPHRMEMVGMVDGRYILDDSKATNPSATISALKSLVRPTILLLGGFDKGTEMKPLLDLANANAKHMIFFGDIGLKLAKIAEENHMKYVLCPHLKDGVEQAFHLSVPGDAILLSPGASSFDEFANYEERGMAFRRYAGVKNETV